MTIRMPADAIRHLYDAMLKPGGDDLSSAGASTMRRIALKGWAFSHDFEDVLSMADRRLSGWGYSITDSQFGAALGMCEQKFCHRPRAIATGAVIHEGWTALDAARIFIFIEALGFAIDPEPIVKHLLPMIPRTGLVPVAALDVLWFAKTRGKSEVTIKSDKPNAEPSEYRDHSLSRGYKLRALLDRDGDPMSLTVRGPKYRRRANPVEVKCTECGSTWWKGDPESSASHRRTHKERMRFLAPQPHDKVMAERQAGEFDEEVTCRSPQWRHDEMYQRAIAFKREMGFDFAQWGNPDRDPWAYGFLFADDEGRIVGICAFRYREYKDHPAGWALQFVWIAPPHRRSGVLASRWAKFRQRFGDFHIEGPVSPSMQAFARKAGDERLMFGSDDAYRRHLAAKNKSNGDGHE